MQGGKRLSRCVRRMSALNGRGSRSAALTESARRLSEFARPVPEKEGLDDLHFQARAAGRDACRPALVQTTVLAWKPSDRSRRPAPSGPGTERSTGVPSGVVSLPRLGDEVRKYGAVIAIIAAIGALIVVLMVWGSNGSDAEGSTCTEIPAGRVPPAIICPGNATPENSKERGCIRDSTFGNATYWTCSD
jgi:hypothetical protein